MVSAEEAFRGVRPSDLRYDNIHMLAEYIAQAQRMIDAAGTTNAESKELLTTFLRAARELVQRSEQAGEQFGEAIDKRQVKLVQALAEMTSALAGAGKWFVAETARAVEAPAAALARATAELLAASASSAATRDEAAEELRKLSEFKVAVNSYLEEVKAHEQESLRRIAEAKTQMYAGTSFWARLLFTFVPPTPHVTLAPAPRRPILRR